MPTSFLLILLYNLAAVCTDSFLIWLTKNQKILNLSKRLLWSSFGTRIIFNLISLNLKQKAHNIIKSSDYQLIIQHKCQSIVSQHKEHRSRTKIQYTFRCRKFENKISPSNSILSSCSSILSSKFFL